MTRSFDLSDPENLQANSTGINPTENNEELTISGILPDEKGSLHYLFLKASNNIQYYLIDSDIILRCTLERIIGNSLGTG